MTRQANLFQHAIQAPYYYNWGVWVARNTEWMRGMLQALLDSERCRDLQVRSRVTVRRRVHTLMNAGYARSPCIDPMATPLTPPAPAMQVTQRVGNPEQDCFLRYTLVTSLQLIYPFSNTQWETPDQERRHLATESHATAPSATRPLSSAMPILSR